MPAFRGGRSRQWNTHLSEW